MVIAGEASGDVLAAELVEALRVELQSTPPTETADRQPLRTGLAPQFFGAGGPRLQAAGVQLAFDLTAHAIVGLAEALRDYLKFKRFFGQLLRLALERQPDVILLVDFSGFNRRFAGAIQRCVRARSGPFRNWRPRIVYYVSPQVWASRPGRALALACDVDLLLSIFPFEKAWYARRVPCLRVEFVGHPLVDRYGSVARWPATVAGQSAVPLVLLLPGSRVAELRRHLPVLLAAAKQLAAQLPVRFLMILPNEELLAQTRNQALSALPELQIQAGGLAQALAEADLAIAKSGTITLECACFGVPAVVFYKTSWPNFLVGRLGVTVSYLAMPNLLAGEMVYPEFIQNRATAGNIAREALHLLTNPHRRQTLKDKLARVVQSLGPPGAGQRAARAILSLRIGME